MWSIAVIIILTSIICFLVKKTLKWKVSATALIYYMEIKKYNLPSDKEMKDCNEYVIDHMVMDLFGKK